MRRKLREAEGERTRFTGRISRRGKKRKGNEIVETILMLNIFNDKGVHVTDHLWFEIRAGFDKVKGLEDGDIVQFYAKSETYLKGYLGSRRNVYETKLKLDYRLTSLRNIKIIKKATKITI